MATETTQSNQIGMNEIVIPDPNNKLLNLMEQWKTDNDVKLATAKTAKESKQEMEEQLDATLTPDNDSLRNWLREDQSRSARVGPYVIKGIQAEARTVESFDVQSKFRFSISDVSGG